VPGTGAQLSAVPVGRSAAWLWLQGAKKPVTISGLLFVSVSLLLGDQHSRFFPCPCRISLHSVRRSAVRSQRQLTPNLRRVASSSSSTFMSSPMSKPQLFAAILTVLVCAPSYANAALDNTATAAQEQSGSRNGVSDETVSQELDLFRSVEVSLREALKIAGKLHAGSRIVDISFDGGSGSPVYRVKTFRQEQIWEDTIDAKTGQVIGNTTVSSLNGLHKEDQTILMALQSVRQELADAVFVAEGNTSGKAISGGLMNEDGKLNFVIVVLSGSDLKQVILEPPVAGGSASRPRRSRSP